MGWECQLLDGWHRKLFSGSSSSQSPLGLSGCVAFVHANYSVAARAAGIVDHASLTEYNSPSEHYNKLRHLLDTLPASEVYLPVHEIATGPALDHELGAPLHIHPSHARNPTAPMAAAVWKRVCLEVNAIWDVARAATDAHNRSEIGRSGLS